MQQQARSIDSSQVAAELAKLQKQKQYTVYVLQYRIYNCDTLLGVSGLLLLLVYYHTSELQSRTPPLIKYNIMRRDQIQN